MPQPQSQLPRIALAGATGNLAPPPLPGHPNLTIKRVNFTSISSLTAVLKESKIEIVISALATHAIGAQNPLIDAAVNAGARRFIPAEFGMDSMNPLAGALPVCEPKAVTRAYLDGKVRDNEWFSWTGIANGLFLDWCLRENIILNLHQHTATLYNGGDVIFSATLLSDVAAAVIGVITHLEETRNRVVYVHFARVSQNQLIGYATEKDGKSWDVTVKGTEEVRRESLMELEKGEGADVDGAMLGFCIVGSWEREYGCDFGGRVDNKLLGVSELSVDEVRGVIWGCCNQKSLGEELQIGIRTGVFMLDEK
ncbi:hypothetical protein BDV12DRAFT_204414 [Aspergillus spectabilis]